MAFLLYLIQFSLISCLPSSSLSVFIPAQYSVPLSAILVFFNFTLGGGGLYVRGSNCAHMSQCVQVCSSGPGVGQVKGDPKYHPQLYSGSAVHPFILCSPPHLLWWKQQEEDSHFIQADCVCYLGN